MSGSIVMRATVKHQKVDKALGTDDKRNTLSIYVEKSIGGEVVWSGNLNINPMSDMAMQVFVKDLGVELNVKTPLRITLEVIEEEILDSYDKKEKKKEEEEQEHGEGDGEGEGGEEEEG